MARQDINAGTGNLRGDGETLHTAFKKINENFIDLYQTSGPSYYVSENGVDSTARSGQRQDDSWASIEYALSQITGPATVHIMAGEYTENLPLTVPENVSVVGESQRTVTVLPANNSTGQMWQLRDGALLAHMTFKGMTGFTPGANPTDIDNFTFNGVFVGLDPASPIVNKSPYIFDCSSISTGGIGALIDGSVHSTGNRSLLIHAYTCINEDGLGYCAINNGKAEIVSGFTYYCHMGYAAANGGIIRSLNGNATYGTYGAVSQGFDATETALTGALYGDQIEFINLVGTFSEGDTITGQTSLAEAVVTDFQANAEKLYIKTTSGTFQEGEIVTNGSGGEAEIAAGGLGGQNGFLLVANGFAERPVAGRSVQLDGDSSSYVIRLISGSYVDSTSVLKLVLSDEKVSKSPDGTSISLRDKFSQVRLTGHDFLNIGTGNKTQTNYPGDPIQTPSQANEIVENRPGRVYFVSTDQDGNFRVGDFFRVEQSTGIATLNANAFDLSGLSSLRLGAVGAQVGELINEFSSDGELSSNSNSKVPTEAAVRTYFQNVKSHIIPEENEVYDLGSATNKWRDLYLSGNTIRLGDSQIQSENSSVVLPAGSKIGTLEASTFSGSFLDLSDVPTTVAGYGITDAVKPGDDISVLSNDSGFVTQTELESGDLSINIGSLEGDLVGSVFADDSTLLVDGVAGTVPGTLTGNWIDPDGTFSVLADSMGITAGSSAVSIADSGIAITQNASGDSSSVGIANGSFSVATTKQISMASNGFSLSAGSDLISMAAQEFVLTASNITISNSHVDADLKGSVFGDDSTVLVDSVNSKIVGEVDTNTIATSSGNLGIIADNYVTIDSARDGQIEIGRASGVGNVVIGNSANQTDIDIKGNITLDTGLTFDFNGATIQNSGLIAETTADSRYVDVSGDTMTGSLTLSGAPTANLEAATKGYVDTVAQGLKARPADDVATDADLNATYSIANNTLTANVAGAITIDSTALSLGQRVLVKDQINAYENGSYVVTQVGDASNPWILTRCGTCDDTSEIPGSFEFIQNGATYEGTGWVAVVPDDFELNNTDPSIDTNYTTRGDITWVQFSGAGTFTAGTGLSLTGTEFANTGVLSVDSNTGSVSSADIMTAVQKEDGAGSGLDADQLDGEEGSYYLDYNNFTNTPTLYTSSDFDTDFGTKSTDNLTEGSTNRYFADSLARNAISASGDLSYNSSTGVISFTERTDSEVKGLFSASGDLSYNSSTGEFSVTVPAGYDSTDFDSDFSKKSIGDLNDAETNTVDENIGIGFDSLRDLTVGSGNTALGQGALQNGEEFKFNTAIGTRALNQLNDDFSGGLLSSTRNTAVGWEALKSATTGRYTTGVGSSSLQSFQTGSANAGFGSSTLYNLTSGEYNTAVGGISLYHLTNGNYNTAVGGRAGFIEQDFVGSNVTLIGFESMPSSPTASNEITLGDTNVSRFRIPGITLDTGDAADGEVLQWNATSNGFAWASLYNSSNFDTDFGAKTTDNLTEGSNNKYYTDAKVQSVIDTNTAGFITQETDTLDTVTGRGSSTSNQISFTGGGSISDGQNGVFVNATNGNVDIGGTGTVTITGAASSAINIGGGTSGTVTIGSGSNLVDFPSGTTVDLTGATINGTGFLTSEANDLTASVTWANVPDANITQSSVTQHEAALSITQSQISDLSIPTNTSDLTNDSGFITSADGGNAATLDGLDSSQFLRSDTNDVQTSGSLRFNDNVELYFGNSNDVTFAWDGSRFYTNIINNDDWYIRDSNANRFLFDISVGDFHADGDVIAFSNSVSDERLKDDITPVENAVDKIKQIDGVTFTRKHNGEKSAGVIAQQLEKILPEAVKEKALPLITGSEEELYKTVEYDALHALLIEAVKELSDRLDQLENK